jgi:nicotinate-nucleotide adenylyltransferase
MQKPIGILGGTFDPIHLGHLSLAKEVYKQIDLQEIRFIPCYQSPLKGKPIASGEQRSEMIKLAIKDHAEFSVDNRELQRKKISYAVETLKSLCHEMKDVPLCLIMSMDAFSEFNLWHKWREIIQLAHLIVANRTGSKAVTNNEIKNLLHERQISVTDKLKIELGGRIFFISIPANPISATEIRRLIKSGENAQHLLPKGVWEYICENKIYM